MSPKLQKRGKNNFIEDFDNEEEKNLILDDLEDNEAVEIKNNLNNKNLYGEDAKDKNRDSTNDLTIGQKKSLDKKKHWLLDSNRFINVMQMA